ncbi:Platelet-activating factor acetylhydrolase, isoform II [Paenibacillus algorifonticola]|uniref:Platelet-activating factor acetylhydrolase, isoform II n=1 Tax=Paenibacillus algorifonticola TaxID=684063 RepID=A0A1I2I027_9BACL|nr:hypothetical protein [Paenibacillus algorifonticola]SFF35602.1 Platelet-activating factor acetylhydrolase, isoform II [Paenibacillus algorifonticola]
MKVFEVIVILIILATAGCLLFARKTKRLDSVMLGTVVLAVLLHGVIDHFRIQMVAAYAVALILIIVLAPRLLKPNDDYIRSRAIIKKGLLSLIVIALSGFSVYASTLLPVFTMPEPNGSYGIGTIARHLTDESRAETHSEDPNDKRELMINVWYPVHKNNTEGASTEHYPSEIGEAVSLVFGIPKQIFSHVMNIPTHVLEGAELSTAEASYPVVLFSPGIRSTRFQSMTAIEELVSNGYIVVGMDHPFTSAKVDFPDGRSILYEAEPEFPTSAELYDNNIKEVAVRVADARFVLDSSTP